MTTQLEGTVRPTEEYSTEQAFLSSRMAEIEKGLGRLAARSGRPTPITQPLDALDRARELVGELDKQVLMRPLAEALRARIAWLERAQARREEDADEEIPDLNRIALDHRILTDLLAEWESREK